MMDIITPKRFLRIADVLVSKGYSIGQPIGEGTYSKVRTAERLQDGTMCAVKIIDRSKVRTDYLTKFWPSELAIIQQLSHKNVIKVFEIIQTKDFIFHIMEYAEKGDILRLIKQNGFLSEEKCKLMFRDVVNGVKYLHDNKIAHRDLKCENILVFSDNRAAISDFGFSCFIDSTCSSMNSLRRTFCGSTAYASPELLQGIPYEPKVNDIWSLGVVLFTMLCGTLPFDDGNVTRMVQKQLFRDFTFSTSVKDKLSEEVKRFVAEILEPNTNERPSIDQLLSSDWVTN